MVPDRNQSEIMTLAEVAEYLQLGAKTVLRMAQRGEIPAAKVASQWRFMREVVRDWLAGRMQTISPEKAAATVPATGLLPLRELVRPDLMSLKLLPGPKDTILRQLVAPLRETGFAKDPARLLVSLIERERMMTTAIGHSVAVPHPRRPIPGMFPEPAVVVGICPAGTDFQAVDDRLVHLFFLLCATREEVHLQLMARVALLTRRQGLTERLAKANSPRQVLEVVSEDAEVRPSKERL